MGATMTVSLRAPRLPSGLMTWKVWPCRCMGCHIIDMLLNVNGPLALLDRQRSVLANGRPLIVQS